MFHYFLEERSIDRFATVKNRILHFCVNNSKSSTISKSKRTGMGLENVKRRLKLLYPNSHLLEINHMEKIYRVNLSIDLKDLTQKVD